MPFKPYRPGEQLAPLYLPKHLRPLLVTDEPVHGRRRVSVLLADGREYAGDGGADYGGAAIILPGFDALEWAEAEYLLTAAREKYAPETDGRRDARRFKPAKWWAEAAVEHLDQQARFKKKQSTFGYGGALIRQD